MKCGDWILGKQMRKNKKNKKIEINNYIKKKGGRMLFQVLSPLCSLST